MSDPKSSKSTNWAKSLADALEAHGLILRGGFQPAAEDGLPLLPGSRPARMLMLVGNAGPALWGVFTRTEEASDGVPHPLNRWTRRVVDRVAARFDALALYPFDAQPAWPFQRWAQWAEPVFPSPLGLLIHPKFGLWHAYRAALLFADPHSLLPPARASHPCETCAEKPCLTACPVGAFQPAGMTTHYDVPACLNHIEGPAGHDCLEAGCRARRVCPVGAEWRSHPAQAGFHMRAFLRGGRGRT
jgi:hypothetical protein